jgi:glycosyltransferase involved in cell wall biosynthesis
MANYAVGLKNGLERLGAKVSIVSAPCACQERLCQTPEMNDTNYRLVRFPPFLNFRARTVALSVILLGLGWVLQLLRGISYLGKSRDCDILHYQQSAFSFGVMPLASVLMIPTMKKRIVTLHSLDFAQLRMRFINRIYRNADCVVVHSEEMASRAIDIGIPKDKIRKVFHGASIPVLQRVARSEVTFFGSPQQAKGISTILKALKILNERNRRVIVHMYGVYSDREKGDTVARAHELGVEGNLVWGGRISDKVFDAKMQGSLVTLLAYSVPVSGSNVLTRAMANGAPIIASSIGGLPEYLGNAGILVQPNDSSRLADEIVRIIDSRKLQEELGSAARSRAIQLFDWQSIAAKTFDIYREVVLV